MRALRAVQRGRVLLAFLVAVGWPPLFEPAVVEALGRIDLRPGPWAEYVVRSSGREDVRLRVTSLPAEGEGRCWLELAMAAQAGIASAARLLVHGDVPAAGIERMVLMLAGQQPIEIPLDARHRTVRNRSPAQNARRRLARVRVPAGAFTAETFRVGRTRVWRSPAVPLWGLVKARSSRQSIELLASGAAGGHSVFPPGWAQGNGSESAK